MNFQNVEFLISAASKENFPTKRLPEIAFAGKSNVGKSSVINRLLQRKNFARVGDKPGKTVHVKLLHPGRRLLSGRSAGVRLCEGFRQREGTLGAADGGLFRSEPH